MQSLPSKLETDPSQQGPFSGEDMVLITPQLLQPQHGPLAAGASGEISCSHAVDPSSLVINIQEGVEHVDAGEDELLLQTVECRICQEEDCIKNMEVPCACIGSLEFAHRKCVQRWCNEKGDITCEICHQPYQPGYTLPPPRPDDATVDISGTWTIGGTPLDFHGPRVVPMTDAERHLLEADFDEDADTCSSIAAFCRSTALVLMALLLLRHALTIGEGDGDEDDDLPTFFSLLLVRAAGFLLPCYILTWAINIVHQRRQRRLNSLLHSTTGLQ